jgi:hypothetical protein
LIEKLLGDEKQKTEKQIPSWLENRRRK